MRNHAQGNAARLDPDTQRINVLEYMGTQGMLSGLDFHVLTLCENLDHKRLNVMLTCPVEDRNEDIVRHADKIGIKFFKLASEKRNGLGYIKRALGLASIIRRRKVQVLHIHAGGYTGFNALLAGWLARVPSVFISHHSLFRLRPYSLGSYLSLALERFLVSRVIVSHNEQKRDMESIGIAPRLLAVVPNGVDLSKFKRTENIEPAGRAYLQMVMVARMIPGKGHDILLRAMKIVTERYPHVRLLMVGDGPLRHEIEALHKELELDGIVTFEGQVAYQDLPTVYSQAHVMVLPTFMPGEEFPTVLMEGMACKLAAISTFHRGIPDIVADGETGLLVKPQDVESLAGAISTLAENPERVMRMGQRARSRVEQVLSTAALGRNITRLYIEAATGQKLKKDKAEYTAQTQS